MANAEQCQRYAAFIKTAGGATMDNPMGLVKTYWDYDDWRTVARRMVQLVQSNIQILFIAGGAIDPQIAATEQQLEARLEDLPTFLGGAWTNVLGGWEEATASAIQVAQEAACELAYVEDATIAVGGAPLIPFKTIKPKKPGDDTYLDELATGAGFGFVLLAALWWWSRDK